jgi:hypothetical protein
MSGLVLVLMVTLLTVFAVRHELAERRRRPMK